MTRRRATLTKSLLFSAIGLLAIALPSAFGQVGDLLVGDVASNTIKRFNATTGAPVGTNGTFASGGGLDTPFGLAYGPDGNLYVSSLGTGTVLEYNGTTGSFIGTFITKGQAGLHYPNQIAFGADHNLYVSSYNPSAPGTILEYAGPTGGVSPGTFLRSFTDTHLMGATGLAFGTTGGVLNNELYVSSSIDSGTPTAHASIFRFDTSVSGSATSGTLFASDPNLHSTAGLSIDPNGNIVAANFNGTNSSITRYDPNTGQNIDGGAFASTVPIFGNIDGPAVAIFGSDLKMYVASYARNAVFRFNSSTGAYDSTFVAKGGVLGQPLYMTFMPVSVGAANFSAVPEPGSIALLGLGLAGIYGYRRVRRQRD